MRDQPSQAGGLPLARRTQSIEPASVGFDQDEPDCGLRNGDAFQVRDAGAGGFNLARLNTADQEIEPVDPAVQVTGMRPPGTAGAADVRRLAARLSPARDAADINPSGIRALSELMRLHYAR